MVSARRILEVRRWHTLDFSDLKKLGVVLKRAQYFLTCSGKLPLGLKVTDEGVYRHLAALESPHMPEGEQLSLFDQTAAERGGEAHGRLA